MNLVKLITGTEYKVPQSINTFYFSALVNLGVSRSISPAVMDLQLISNFSLKSRLQFSIYSGSPPQTNLNFSRGTIDNGFEQTFGMKKFVYINPNKSLCILNQYGFILLQEERRWSNDNLFDVNKRQ